MRLAPTALVVWLAGAVLLVPASAMGSEEAAGESGSSMDFIGKIVNFVILFGGLAFVLRKPLGKFLAQRTEAVRLGLEAASGSRSGAQAKLREVEERAGRLQSEIDEIRAKARAAGEAEKEKILAAARQEAARLKDFSRQEVDALVRADVRQLREYAADKAIALALERVRASLTAEAQSRLIDAAIDRLSKIHEKRDTGPTLRPRAH